MQHFGENIASYLNRPVVVWGVGVFTGEGEGFAPCSLDFSASSKMAMLRRASVQDTREGKVGL
jgi:hypothetical protein